MQSTCFYEQNFGVTVSIFHSGSFHEGMNMLGNHHHTYCYAYTRGQKFDAELICKNPTQAHFIRSLKIDYQP